MDARSIRFICCVLFFLGGFINVFAQVTITANTKIKVNGTMMIKGAVNNQSAQTQLTTADVLLAGINQTLSTTTPVQLKSLTVDGGGIKTIAGNWTVQESLDLKNGIVQVSPAARLLYTGSGDPHGSETSYITGRLYYQGSGKLFFPVGTATNYAPVTLENAPSGEYSVAVVAGDPAFALPPGIESYYPGHYWDFSEAPGATVSLSLNGVQPFLQGNAPIVLEAPETGGIAMSLSGSVSGNFVTSAQPLTLPVAAIGIVPEFTLTIHDMITPFTIDEVNDKLYIRNIELTSSNKVRLLDRYGALVGEWNNYSNTNDEDFQRFGPGNYVCIVEYTSPGSTAKRTVKGMVTILKAN